MSAFGCKRTLQARARLSAYDPKWILDHQFRLELFAKIWSVRIHPARQAHREHRAFARLARHGYVAAHHARELAGDGKAEPGSAVAFGGRRISLGEFLKQLCQLVSRHTNAGVSHGEFDPVALVDYLSHSQRDLALLGELAGIAQQIEQGPAATSLGPR
jgi:hypothetical protein